MQHLLRGGLLLAASTSFALPTTARDACGGTTSHCHLPRWVPQTASSLDEVGHTVAFDGDTAAVAAPGASAVHVYERDGALWSLVATVDDPFGTGNDFGAGLDLEGDLLVVGSPEDDTLVAGAGAAHIFERTGGSWTYIESFFDPSPTVNGHFGYAVAVATLSQEGTGEWIGIGAPGDDGTGSFHSIYRIDGGWVYNSQHDYMASGQFGASLDVVATGVSGYSAQFYVGSWGNDLEGVNAGAVHSFQVTTGLVVVTDPFTLPELESGDFFGRSVSFDGEHLLVGAYGDDDVAVNAGAAYLFDVDLGGFPQLTLVEKLLPCDGSVDDHFGWSVGIDGSNAAVGAPGEESTGAPGGSVHVFAPSFLGGWQLPERIAPDDGASGDLFGQDVAVAGSRFLVGARGVDTTGGDHAGAAYLISKQANLPGGECPCDALAMAETYGEGKPGTLGVPELDASAPIPGKTGTVSVRNALPGVAPILIWGEVPAALPFDDGTLLIADPHFELLPVVGPLQQVGMGWSVPAGPALCGIDLYAQAIFLDPGADGPYHTAQTNGLRLSIGY